MKLAIFILALASSSCFASDFNSQRHDSPTPLGASGPGVVHTVRTTGRVIAIGNPLYKLVPVGNTCSNNHGAPVIPQNYENYRNQPQPQPQQQHPSSINPGTVLGGLVGGSIGSLAGKGRGREIMIAGGMLAGAMIGTEAYNESRNDNQQHISPRCEPIFENRVVGYPFVVQHGNIQLRGTSRHQLNIGDEVEVIVRSTLYPGN